MQCSVPLAGQSQFRCKRNLCSHTQEADPHRLLWEEVPRLWPNPEHPNQARNSPGLEARWVFCRQPLGPLELLTPNPSPAHLLLQATHLPWEHVSPSWSCPLCTCQPFFPRAPAFACSSVPSGTSTHVPIMHRRQLSNLLSSQRSFGS